MFFLVLQMAYALTAPMTPVNLDFDKGTYFAIDLKVAPFADALKQAEKKHGSALRTRGEAHLTVITPPEYVKLNADQRKAIIADLKRIDWSKPQITVKCIGRGQAVLKDQVESAYFLVVEAPEIVAVRSRFHLGEYFPHITLGFTKRDLHFEDGVKKDSSSCLPEP